MFPRLEKHISMLSALHKRRNLYSYNWIVQLVDISAKVLLIVSVCTVCLWNVSFLAVQITFNGGAQWSDLQKPDTYNYPECNRCKDLADTKCQLHLHGPTGWVEGPGDFLHVLLSGCFVAYTMKRPFTQSYQLACRN